MFSKKRPDNIASDHILTTVRCISETFYRELIWARHFLSAWKVWTVVLFFVGFWVGVVIDDVDGIRFPMWVLQGLFGVVMIAFPIALVWMIFRK